MERIIKFGITFMVHTTKFNKDYGRTFKEKKFLINAVDITEDIENIIKEYGIQKDKYQHLLK